MSGSPWHEDTDGRWGGTLPVLRWRSMFTMFTLYQKSIKPARPLRHTRAHKHTHIHARTPITSYYIYNEANRRSWKKGQWRCERNDLFLMPWAWMWLQQTKRLYALLSESGSITTSIWVLLSEYGSCVYLDSWGITPRGIVAVVTTRMLLRVLTVVATATARRRMAMQRCACHHLHLEVIRQLENQSVVNEVQTAV
jgi:hypothetical protein